MGAPQPKPFAEKKNVRYGTSVSSRKDFLFFLKTKRNETKRKERGGEKGNFICHAFIYIYFFFEIVTLRSVRIFAILVERPTSGQDRSDRPFEHSMRSTNRGFDWMRTC